MKRKFNTCANCEAMLWKAGMIACRLGFEEDEVEIGVKSYYARNGWIRYTGQGLVHDSIGYFQSRLIPEKCDNETYEIIRKLREL